MLTGTFWKTHTSHNLKHNRTFWKDHVCVRASVWFPTNQYLESAIQLINQIAPATSIFCPLRCARTHFPCLLPMSRFTSWFGVSLISLSLAQSYTCVLIIVNTQYLSSQRLSFLSLGATAYSRDD